MQGTLGVLDMEVGASSAMAETGTDGVSTGRGGAGTGAKVA